MYCCNQRPHASAQMHGDARENRLATSHPLQDDNSAVLMAASISECYVRGFTKLIFNGLSRANVSTDEDLPTQDSPERLQMRHIQQRRVEQILMACSFS